MRATSLEAFQQALRNGFEGEGPSLIQVDV
jgi:hypothetical protein